MTDLIFELHGARVISRLCFKLLGNEVIMTKTNMDANKWNLGRTTFGVGGTAAMFLSVAKHVTDGDLPGAYLAGALGAASAGVSLYYARNLVKNVGEAPRAAVKKNLQKLYIGAAEALTATVVARAFLPTQPALAVAGGIVILDGVRRYLKNGQKLIKTLETTPAPAP
jgi:hypothetical protein